MKAVLTLRLMVDTPQGHPTATAAFEVPEWRSAYQYVPNAASELVERLTKWMAEQEGKSAN